MLEAKAMPRLFFYIADWSARSWRDSSLGETALGLGSRLFFNIHSLSIPPLWTPIFALLSRSISFWPQPAVPALINQVVRRKLMQATRETNPPLD